MKIKSFSTFKVKIPMRFSFSHNLSKRFESESIIVRVEDEKGNCGYGEGAPRSYVTGENLTSCDTFLKEIVSHWVLKKVWNNSIESRNDLLHFLSEFHAEFPTYHKDEVIAWNASKSAVEIAILDCLFHRINGSFHDFFPMNRENLFFGAGIGAYSPIKSAIIALIFVTLGFKDIKIKLNHSMDKERISMVRSLLGDNICIRVDANMGYDFNKDEDLQSLMSLKEYNVISIEQPFIRGNHKEIRKIKPRIGVPLMADESLITEEDGLQIIEEGSYDAFNLRVSRLGGIYPFMRMVELARENGIWFQIGCHIGELAILSRVGQLLASYYPDAKYLEGGYGRLLLKTDIDKDSKTIDYAGKMKVQESSNFGYEIHEEILKKYSRLI